MSAHGTYICEHWTIQKSPPSKAAVLTLFGCLDTLHGVSSTHATHFHVNTKILLTTDTKTTLGAMK